MELGSYDNKKARGWNKLKREEEVGWFLMVLSCPPVTAGLLPQGSRLVGGLGLANERGLDVRLALYSRLPTALLQG